MKQSPSPESKRGQKRRIRLFLFVMLGFSIWFGYTVYLQSRVLAEKESQLQQYREQLAATQAQQAELKYKLSRLNDQEYIAELARKNFFLAKPGEVIYVLPEK